MASGGPQGRQRRVSPPMRTAPPPRDAAAQMSAAARRSLKTERLSEHIRRTVDAAPPLTPEQRDRLALLLRAPSGDAR